MKSTLDSLIYFTEFSEDDRRVLREAAKHTQLWADEFVQMFYDTLFACPFTKDMFHEGERPKREQTIREWYLRVRIEGRTLARCQCTVLVLLLM